MKQCFLKRLLIVETLIGLCFSGTSAVLMVNPALPASSGYCFKSLSEALLAANSGDIILLQPGHYDSNVEQFPIKIDKHVTISAIYGPKDTVFLGPEKKEVFLIAASDVVLSGITIRHQGSGITVIADNVKVINCEIELLPTKAWVFTCGIWLVGVHHAHIVRNTFVNCGLAIVGPRPSIEDLGKPSLTGIFLVGDSKEWFSTHVIRENLVNGSPLMYLVGLRGINVTGKAGQIIIVDCEDITIYDLSISHASVGIEIAHSQNVLVKNCELSKNSLFGLYIAYSNKCRATKIRAVDNNHGIDLRASFEIVISDCFLEGNEQGLFFSHTKSCAACNCQISNNGVGIFGANALLDLFCCNYVHHNRYGLLLQNSDGLMITKNNLANNSNGLRLHNSSNINIITNSFDKCTINLFCVGGSNILVYANKISRSTDVGIYLWDAANLVIMNNVFDNNVLGLELTGNNEKILLHLNIFKNNIIAIYNNAQIKLNAQFNWWIVTDTTKALNKVEGNVILNSVLKKLISNNILFLCF